MDAQKYGYESNRTVRAAQLACAQSHGRCWIAPFVIAALLAARARAQSSACVVSEVSVATSGQSASADSQRAWISTDGRFVVFGSAATNLASGDFNACADVFVHDRHLGTTQRVSVSDVEQEADGPSHSPSISDDGRFVVFESTATNLVADDLNLKSDVFLRDRATGRTRLVSVSSDGVQGNGWSYAPVLSADGGTVAFLSRSTNLAPGDTNGTSADVYVYDVANELCERASVSAAGACGNFPSESVALSGDGRFVAFASVATNLVPGDPPAGPTRIYLRDRASGTTQLVSRTPGGGFPNGRCEDPAISRDGAIVAFQSAASNLVDADTNDAFDVFVCDWARGVTERASVTSNDVQADGESSHPSLSPDGTLVLFASYATNLVAGDTNGFDDVFVRDLVGTTTRRVSVTSSGAPADGRSTASTGGRLASGGVALFDSLATNLTSSTSSARWQLFTRECLDEIFVSFCFGTNEACPCGNGSEQPVGCMNSVGLSGADLVATGAPSVSVDSLQLSVRNMPTFAAVLYFQGDATLEGGAGVALGDGLKCVGGSLRRLGLRVASGGESSLGFGIAGDLPLSQMGGIVQANVTRHYQALYRDVTEFCSASTLNLSNAITVRWVP